jgi:hypothetical protein
VQQPPATTNNSSVTTETGKLTGEMSKDSNSFWTQTRAAGLFRVAKDKLEHQHMTWQEIWKELSQPSVNGNRKTAVAP